MNSESTSFIPQRPVQGKVKKRGVRKVYVLTYISYVVFFGTLLAAAGIFFLTTATDRELKNQIDALAVERDSFSEGDIQSILELDKRINIAKDKMNQHVSLLSVFEAIEKSTLKSLQFVGFSYHRLNMFAPSITLTGTANTFDSVLFQREVLKANPILAGGTFTDTLLQTVKEAEDKSGSGQQIISFVFTNNVSPSLIQYAPRTQVDTPQETVTDSQSQQIEGTSTQEQAVADAQVSTTTVPSDSNQ